MSKLINILILLLVLLGCVEPYVSPVPRSAPIKYLNYQGKPRIIVYPDGTVERFTYKNSKLISWIKERKGKIIEEKKYTPNGKLKLCIIHKR